MINLLLAINEVTIKFLVINIFVILPIIIGIGIYNENKLKRKKREEQERKKEQSKKNTPKYVQRTPQNNINKYEIYKPRKLLTKAEIEFYNKLLRATYDKNVIILPQINLASIIDKNFNKKYRLELFRNIDFGVFDTEYNLLLLIEYNDATHLQPDRKHRDYKVKEICELSGIPLVTFWTKDENEIEYIQEKINEHVKIETAA